MQIARCSRRLVESINEAPSQGDLGRTRCPQQQRVAARVCEHQDLLAWINLRPLPGPSGIIQQATEDRGHIRRDRITQWQDLHIINGWVIKDLDQATNPLEIGCIVSDHERVVVRIRRDRIVGRDQGPQDSDQVRRRLVAQLVDLRQDLITRISTSGDFTSCRRDLAALHLGVRLGHNTQQSSRFDDRKPLHAQRRLQHLQRRRAWYRLGRLQR